MRKGLLVLIGVVLCLAGCGLPEGTPPGAVVGRYDVYDYSPSVIQTGNLQQFWWCGIATNPTHSSQTTDTIQYESIDVTTQVKVGPMTVLAETAGAWDSMFTCNPHVIRGVFTNPLGDKTTYTYALYYVGTSNGTNNSIGVAFSNDGMTWKKYPNPVVPFTSLAGYGTAQPVPYNTDRKQAVTLFYEDSTASGNHHSEATSPDGVHFTTVGNLTMNGLDPNNPGASWGDMAFDPSTHFWYATYNLNSRIGSTTGKKFELGSMGIQLYRIPEDSLLNGQTAWQQIKTFDTNLTGYESVFLAAILGDGYGNVVSTPTTTVQLFPSFSNVMLGWNASESDAGSAGKLSHWDIGSMIWSSLENPQVALNRYTNGSIHLVTTGRVDPAGKFQMEQNLGHLYEAPQAGATMALYNCKASAASYLVSQDYMCGGSYIVGLEGYGYASEVPGLSLNAIYRCAKEQDVFVSKDPQCEGGVSSGQLGYVLP